MSHFAKTIAIGLLFALATGLVAEPAWTSAFGQSRSSKSRKKSSRSRKKSKKTPSLKALDVRAQRARQTFIREAYETSRLYEKAGQYDRSKLMLSAILKLDPSQTAIKAKIKQLDEMLLASNKLDIEVDTSRGWGLARVRVFKGRKIRIQSEGNYRFVTSLVVGPVGFPSKKPAKGDMAAGIPTGALMGLIAAKGNTGKPFLVGNGLELTPKTDGFLFLNVNVPPGAKCSGKIRVRITGYVAKP
ncbi:MAG: hypothetical protein IID45_04970 [Planctomycetes bacterium]|nr:hypothetical protein [Planctomycetota bacterium]